MSKLHSFVIGAVLLSAGAVSSTPSTQIWIPSTDIQSFGKLHIGLDTYIKVAGDPSLNGTMFNGGLTIGVLPFHKVGLEIGIDYRDISGNHLDPLYFNAKLGAPEDSLFKYCPAVAVGGFDFGTRVNVTTYNVVYGLAAKTIWKLGRFSVGGYRGGVFVDAGKVFSVASDPTRTDDAGVLASWDKTLSEIPKIGDKLWLAVDFQSGKNGYGAVSFGVSWKFAPTASLLLGYDIWNDHDALKPTVTLQVDLDAF